MASNICFTLDGVTTVVSRNEVGIIKIAIIWPVIFDPNHTNSIGLSVNVKVNLIKSNILGSTVAAPQSSVL